jgi:hypothetical protein
MQFETAGRIFVKYDTGEFSVNLVCHVNCNLNRTFLTTTLDDDLLAYQSVSRRNFIRDKNISYQIVQKNKTRILYAIRLLHKSYLFQDNWRNVMSKLATLMFSYQQLPPEGNHTQAEKNRWKFLLTLGLLCSFHAVLFCDITLKHIKQFVYVIYTGHIKRSTHEMQRTHVGTGMDCNFLVLFNISLNRKFIISG